MHKYAKKYTCIYVHRDKYTYASYTQNICMYRHAQKEKINTLCVQETKWKKSKAVLTGQNARRNFEGVVLDP